ncbi:MAG TPA: 5-(carboxyamino)imidazole ribonucleotide synthase [Sporichthyaceae bacterium]|nr:5-(carboxyamino)imidazole ribonucleotide synthase [Sporichthyaceae bacterium]
MTAPVVGMVGDGQLARMTAQAAIALDVRLRVLASSADSAAAKVAADVTLGDHDNLDDLRAFAAGCDVLTFDHEHVPIAHLEALVAEGVVVRPGPEALRHAQDKLLMRTRLSAAGIPHPDWADVTEVAELALFGDSAGWPVIVKTPRGGYDGRGVREIHSAAAAADWVARGPLLVETRVEFDHEIAVLLARSPHGQAAIYPVVQTVQRAGICREVIVPAPISAEHQMEALKVALAVAEELDVVGLLAVEMFHTEHGVLVNELAMRPHNSGHWTIDGAVTSQFEQHLRAVLDWPLGDTAMLRPRAVMANVLGGPHPDLHSGYLHCMAHDPGLRIHNYGKKSVPGRKVGHVTVTGDDPEDLLARARHAATFLTGEAEEGSDG